MINVFARSGADSDYIQLMKFCQALRQERFTTDMASRV